MALEAQKDMAPDTMIEEPLIVQKCEALWPRAILHNSYVTKI